MNKINKIIIFFICFLFLAGFLHSALAQDRALEVGYPDIPGAPTPTTIKTPLPDYIKYLFNFSIILAALIAFISLVYGGFSYLTSAGSPQKTQDARERIFAAILGLLLLLGSYIILATINPQLVSFGIEKEVNKPDPIEAPIPDEPDQIVHSYFMIPTGAIIESLLLDNDAQTKFNNIVNTADSLRASSENLKNLDQDLKNLIFACQCGNSNCSSIDGTTGAGCSSQGAPNGCPSAHCDKNAINNKINEIKSAIEDVKSAQDGISLVQLSTIDEANSLLRARILMTLPNYVEDYSNILTMKYDAEQSGEKLEITSFPDWPSNIITSEDGRTYADRATFYINKDTEQDAIDFAESFEPISIPTNPSTGLIITSSPPPIPPDSPEGILDVPFYSQRDPEWANKIMGSTSCRYGGRQCCIGNVGCLLTSIAMSLNDIGFDWSPYDVLSDANSKKMISTQANLSTVKYLTSLAKELDFTYRKIYNNNEMGNYPLVTYCKSFKYVAGHFIVVTGVKDGRVYINDPYWHVPSLSAREFKNYGCGAYYHVFEK